MMRAPSMMLLISVFAGACSGESSMKGGSSKQTAGASAETADASSETAGGSENDDETRVMPPEVVSGSYLTCAFDQTYKGDGVLFGCNAFEPGGRRIKLPKNDTLWNLLSAVGVVIDAPAVVHASFDIAWIVTRLAAEDGIEGQAVVTRETNEIVLDQKGGPSVLPREPAAPRDPVMVYE